MPISGRHLDEPVLLEVLDHGVERSPVDLDALFLAALAQLVELLVRAVVVDPVPVADHPPVHAADAVGGHGREQLVCALPGAFGDGRPGLVERGRRRLGAVHAVDGPTDDGRRGRRGHRFGHGPMLSAALRDRG